MDQHAAPRQACCQIVGKPRYRLKAMNLPTELREAPGIKAAIGTDIDGGTNVIY